MNTKTAETIEELEEIIRRAQNKIEELKKIKHFEWDYHRSPWIVGEDRIYGIGNNDCKDTRLEHGRYRSNKDVAIQSLMRNKVANRLEALCEQLGGLKEFKVGDLNYSILWSNNEWVITYYQLGYKPEVVYMTKECAVEVCRMLNNNEFSLVGEE